MCVCVCVVVTVPQQQCNRYTAATTEQPLQCRNNRATVTVLQQQSNRYSAATTVQSLQCRNTEQPLKCRNTEQPLQCRNTEQPLQCRNTEQPWCIATDQPNIHMAIHTLIIPEEEKSKHVEGSYQTRLPCAHACLS
jgi:hypothetical protein